MQEKDSSAVHQRARRIAYTNSAVAKSRVTSLRTSPDCLVMGAVDVWASWNRHRGQGAGAARDATQRTSRLDVTKCILTSYASAWKYLATGTMSGGGTMGACELSLCGHLDEQTRVPWPLA
eukprot:scaffold110125_cov35-Tisochrysis_lutea.AAC.1